jgi:hypothetical protein
MIKKELPPNFKSIEKVFGPHKGGVVYTYGDTIYSPDAAQLSPDLVIHEMVHMSQQGKDPEGWWKKYLSEQDFRLAQETEAYQAQFKYLKSIVKHRNGLFNYAHKLACDLAGPIYGNMISYSKAFELVGYKHS